MLRSLRSRLLLGSERALMSRNEVWSEKTEDVFINITYFRGDLTMVSYV